MTLPANLAPHPTLHHYYGNRVEKREFVNRVFDRAAHDYDRVENMMALGTGRWYRRQALIRAGLKSGMRVLDVAVGTGLVAREEIRIVGDPMLVVGLDPSLAMMRQATASLGIRSILGVGEQLPLADAQFDFVSMGYALRHLSDMRATFAQFHRVLRPGGTVCILEISRPQTAVRRSLLRAYMRYVVPALSRLTTRGGDSRLLWQYYWDTIEACVPCETVIKCLHNCGLINVSHQIKHGIFSEYTAMRPM